nr:hypothetical protein [Tumebacillus amylolyticus]
MIQRELDDDLSLEETELLDGHTATCADCRTEREEYRQLALGLRSMKAVVPERSFVSQMEFDFDELLRPQPQVTPLQKKGRRLPNRWWQGLSVAAVVVIAIGFTANYLPGTSSNEAKSGLQNGTPLAQVTTPTTQTPTSEAPATTGSAVQNPVVVALNDSKVQQQTSKNDAASANVNGSSTNASTKNASSATASAQNGTSGKAVSQTVTPLQTKPTTPATPTAPSKDSTQPVVPTGPVVAENDHHTSGGTGMVGATKPSDSHTGLVADGGPVTVAVSPSLQDRDHAYGLVAGALSAERPPLPLIIGFIQQKPSVLNEKLQAQVHTGDTSVRWATDPDQVVQHVLTDIGFAPTAIVTGTKDPDRVNVQQGGQQYIVKLSQPFDSGADGIWQPVQISRMLSMTSQELTDKPILEYFDHLQSINTVKFSNIQVEESLFMGRTVVGADMTSYTPYGDVETRLVFSFHLRLNGDYTWSLDGTPTIRH